MNRTLALFAIGLIFGGGIGFALAAGNGITFDGHDHGDAAQHGGMVDPQRPRRRGDRAVFRHRQHEPQIVPVRLLHFRTPLPQ